MHKLLIPIQGDFIAPRFDLATEILIVRFKNGETTSEPKIIILERPSDEALCQMAVEENITDVVCGGIEDIHYRFLIWKKVTVIDAIIGDWQTALEKILGGTLQQGDILTEKNDERLTL
jgi:predicted Fe-Mo cluster-binding NifX family protein